MKKQSCGNKNVTKKNNSSNPGLDLGSRLANYQVNQLNNGSDNNGKLVGKKSNKTLKILQQERTNIRFSRSKKNRLLISFNEKFCQEIELLSDDLA